MGTKEYTAMLNAVEQAIAICDRSEHQMDDARRQVWEDLNRLRHELRAQLNDLSSG